MGAYRPARWPEEPGCGVIRRDGDGEQRLLEPVCMVILVSHDRLPVAELVRRHRGKQGQENAFKGPLTDLGLQPPPCRSPAANQGFYLGGQIAQLQLLQYQALPSAARQPGLRPLIRHFVCSARRLRLLCSRSNLWLDWLLHAGSRARAGPARLEPRRAQRQGTAAEPAGGSVRLEPGAQRLRCVRRPAQGACAGAQVARRRAAGPAPGTPGSPLKPYGPLNRHFGKLTGNLGKLGVNLGLWQSTV